jgi:hypothetical protein
MQKRKSTRETKNMVQTALWLPREMHEVLKKAGGERGLGEEIRRRLQMAFKAADDTLAMPGDDVTEEVLDQIEDITRDLSRDDPWYADAFKVDVLNAAVNTLLLVRRPSGEANPEIRARLQAEYGEEKAEAIGRLLARATMIAHSREGAGRAISKR